MKSKHAFTLLLIMFLLPAVSFAECDPFYDGSNDTTPCVDNAPIDSWLLVLLIAGAAYGYNKYRKVQKPAVK